MTGKAETGGVFAIANSPNRFSRSDLLERASAMLHQLTATMHPYLPLASHGGAIAAQSTQSAFSVSSQGSRPPNQYHDYDCDCHDDAVDTRVPIRTADRKQLPGDVYRGVEDHRSEDALARVVIKPDDKNPSRDRAETPPGDPCGRPVNLHQRHNVPNGPHQPQQNARWKCAPTILHRMAYPDQPSSSPNARMNIARDMASVATTRIWGTGSGTPIQRQASEGASARTKPSL